VVKKAQQTFDIEELQSLLSVFKQTMSDLYRKETSSLHCSITHLEILHYINEHKNPTMKDIAGYLHITPPSVTTLIDFMVQHKLVKRENEAVDRRTVRVVLMPQAKKMHSALLKKKTTMLNALLKKLSMEQKQQLSEIIRTLVK
jgi:DNA-binding MarR family transcriptional regulator